MFHKVDHDSASDASYSDRFLSQAGKKPDLTTLTNQDLKEIDFRNVPFLDPNELTEQDLSAILQLDLSTPNVKGKTFAEYLKESLREGLKGVPNRFAEKFAKILEQFQATIGSSPKQDIARAYLKRSLESNQQAVDSKRPKLSEDANVFDVNQLIGTDISEMDFGSLPLLTPDNLHFDFHALTSEQRRNLAKVNVQQADRNGVSLREYLEKSFVAFATSNPPQNYFTLPMLRLISYTKMSQYVREQAKQFEERWHTQWQEQQKQFQSKFPDGFDDSDNDTPFMQEQKSRFRALVKAYEQQMDRALQILKENSEELRDGNNPHHQQTDGSGPILFGGSDWDGLKALLLSVPKLDMGAQDLSMPRLQGPKSAGAPDAGAQGQGWVDPFANSGLNFGGFSPAQALLAFVMGHGTVKGIIDIDKEKMNEANNDVEAELARINDLNEAYKLIMDYPYGTGTFLMTWYETVYDIFHRPIRTVKHVDKAPASMTFHIISTVDGVLKTTETTMAVKDGLKQFYDIDLVSKKHEDDTRKVNTDTINAQKQSENSKLNSLEQKASAAYNTSNDHLQSANSMLMQFTELMKTLVQNTHA